MASSLGTSMCGTSQLHTEYCIHPCCGRARQQAGGAGVAVPPATPAAADGHQGQQQQQTPCDQQQGQQHGQQHGQQQGQQQGQQAAARRLGLIIDGLNKVQIGVCAYPGCGSMPKDGKRAMWCAQHEELYASGCRAAAVQQEVGEDGAPLVLPCCRATTGQRSQFCAQHAQQKKDCTGRKGGAPGALMQCYIKSQMYSLVCLPVHNRWKCCCQCGHTFLGSHPGTPGSACSSTLPSQLTRTPLPPPRLQLPPRRPARSTSSPRGAIAA
jgi:hypothetical protein